MTRLIRLIPLVAGALLGVLLPVAVARAQTDYSTSLRVGGAAGSGAPQGSSMRITGTGTRTAGQPVLGIDAGGNVLSGLLGKVDLPSSVAYEDEANTFGPLQTFSGGLAASVVRGTTTPFVVRNSTGAADVVSVYDNGVARLHAAATDANWDFYAASGASGQRYWRHGLLSGQYAVQGLDDSYTVAADLFRAYQTGGVPTALRWGAGVRSVSPQTALYSNLGEYLSPYATLHVGELRASALVVNETQAYTEASLKVGRGSTLTRPLTVGDTRVYTKTRFTKYLDFLILRGLSDTGQPQYEVVQVSAAATGDCTGAVLPLLDVCSGVDNDDYALIVTRNVDGSGANAWPAGSAVVSMDRWIDIFSDSGGFISFGNAVMGDRPSAYWTFDAGVTTTPNRSSGPRGWTAPPTALTRADGGAIGECGGGGYAAAMSVTNTCGAWYAATDGTHSVTGSPVSVPEINRVSFSYAQSVELLFFTGAGGAGPGYAVKPYTRWVDGDTTQANVVVYYFGDAGGVDAGGLVVYGTNGGAWQNLTQRVALAPATWYHLVFTWDTWTGGRLYVDGSLVPGSIQANPTPGSALGNYLAPLGLSLHKNAGGLGQHLSELAIYDYVLGADAVAAHWAALQTARPAITNGPSLVGYVATGTNWYDQAPRWGLGNLQGLYDYATETYGFAAGNAAATWIAADAVQGFRILHGSTPTFHATPDGHLDLLGSLTVGASGHIKGGATAFATGAGFWLGHDAGLYKFYIGSGTGPTDQYLTWDGASLSIAGALSATSTFVLGAAANIVKGSGPLAITVTSPGQGLTLSAGGGIGRLTLNAGELAIGGAFALTATKTVLNAAGVPCTLIYTLGALTGGTCS